MAAANHNPGAATVADLGRGQPRTRSSSAPITGTSGRGLISLISIPIVRRRASAEGMTYLGSRSVPATGVSRVFHHRQLGALVPFGTGPSRPRPPNPGRQHVGGFRRAGAVALTSTGPWRGNDGSRMSGALIISAGSGTHDQRHHPTPQVDPDHDGPEQLAGIFVPARTRPTP